MKIGKKMKWGQNLKFENRSTFWKLGKILKTGQNFENWAKFWKLGKIWKNGQNFENGAKFRKLCKILKIGQNVENQAKLKRSGKILKIWQNLWKTGQNFKNFDARQMRVISQLLAGTSTNDARASNPAKNWSHKSARHLQKTRARNLRGDTRGLPEAKIVAVSLFFNTAYFRGRTSFFRLIHLWRPITPVKNS